MPLRLSDGGSPPREMAESARDLGHEWIALTDHSPRLTVAGGLSADRLLAQLELVTALNGEPAPIRTLTGIEVAILAAAPRRPPQAPLPRLSVVAGRRPPPPRGRRGKSEKVIGCRSCPVPLRRREAAGSGGPSIGILLQPSG